VVRLRRRTKARCHLENRWQEAEAVVWFNSAQFGSADQFKGLAMGIHMPLIKDKVALDDRL
jgi:hypothetical protein